ncbi:MULTISPECIES: carbohydrate ABC transporter permease [unclassified Frondihabitans]|uniref:carbohydrate ABC transporter permease n=1 Tax=unclassified Frondihabitans TaxID=2626248 RepID=UPI000F4F7DF8|nr:MULTISPECIES: sugar ABC transporter permease [unclassified Frondihabitans]RPE76154.1 multiple sugar transport system permease protein [Frondihabitans sp. PhB153]RPF05570.1 multiple sugar transport system permease protein [Frondihabitans sp. PhB161]
MTAAPALTRRAAAAPEARPKRHSVLSRGDGRGAWLFLAPFGLFYLAFLLGPTIWMVITSFFNTSTVRTGLGSFAGVANYAEMLGRADFWSAMWHTLQFTLYTTPPLVILAFFLAILTNRVRRGQWFFRLAFFLPYILPSATISLIWVFIFTPGSGLWASAQSIFGITPGAGVLASPNTAMIGIAIATIWWTLGFNFVLYLAGLQEIPRELYEAAAVDGASTWEQIRYITLPLLSRTTTLVLLLQIVASLKIFDQVYLMTSGGPGISTSVALTLVTGTGFTDNRLGAASAASVLLLIVIIAIAVIRQLVDRAAVRKAA